MRRIALTFSLLALGFQLFASGSALAASTYVPRQLMQSEGELSQLLEEFIPKLDQIDQKGLAKIREAVDNFNRSTTRFQKRYYQYDYVEQRTDHVRNIAVLLIELIDRHEQTLEQGKYATRWHRAYIGSPEIKGLQNVVRMAVYIDERSPTQTDTYQGKLARARNATLGYLLASLVTPPHLADAEYLADIKKMRLEAYNGLESLKQEMDQLSTIYARLKSAGG